MKLNKFKEKVVNHIINIPGWRTNRKIIVFESDDWGSIRMRSRRDYDFFKEKGFRVDQCPYNKFDSLESNDDLVHLYEALSQFEDRNGNSPVFTFNVVVTNPDFSRIKQNNFQTYYFESFLDTLKRYPNHDKVYSLYKKGIDKRLIKVQFHGREHLNVKHWMKAISNGEQKIIEAFDREMFTVHDKGSILGRNNYLDTYGLADTSSLSNYEEELSFGTNLFCEIFGKKSESFIAPTYVWPKQIENILFKNGVKYLQGTHVQRVPRKRHEDGIDRKYHYLGQKNKLGQIYLVRNAFFEPSSDANIDWVNSCLKDIHRAFFYKKPAIISTHRGNYIGGIFLENRKKNLLLLKLLLEKIIELYPDIEFMSSDSLGRTIESN